MLSKYIKKCSAVLFLFFLFQFCFSIPFAKGADSQPEASRQEKASSGLSPFEEYARARGLEIEQFGYDLFIAPPSTFAPVETVPVGPDYLLGPGDELKISLWGKLNAEYSSQIDREGQVHIPSMGVLTLSGLTFAEAKAYLEKEFSRYYNLNEVKMNVSMGTLRTVRVFVLGKARRPGSYTLSSLSTLVNAIFAAGGPNKSGSMREIQVKRAGKVVTKFDLYDLLLNGDKTKDIRLAPEDVIFIPPVGPIVGLAGEVKTPAIYELKGESTVKQLIDLAGGLNELAFTGRLQIERVVERSRAVVFESTLNSLKPEDAKIQQGDIIKVFPIVQDRMVVRLAGAVNRSGEYGLGDGLAINDLIGMAGGLAYNAYYDDAELTRVTPTQSGPETVKIHVNLKKALSGDPEHNLKLKQNDFLFIRPVPEWELYRTVTVRGQVKFPGVYTVLKGETISSLIERTGGYTEKAYLKGAIFTRQSVRDIQQKQLDEAIDRLEQEMLSQTIVLQQQALDPEEAKQQQSVIAQQRALLGKMRAAKAKGRVSIKLDENKVFKKSYSNLVLEEGDILEIPEKPVQVQVIGSVYNQTAFVHNPNSTVDGYIKKAGGFTKNADEDDIYVLKVDGTARAKREASSWGFHWDEETGKWVGGGFMSSRLDPGDTVVIPEDFEKVMWMKEAKDITQILYQIAVTAGVLIVAF